MPTTRHIVDRFAELSEEQRQAIVADALQATSAHNRQLCRAQALRAIQAMSVEPVVSWDAPL